MHPHHLKICGLTTREAIERCAHHAIGFFGLIAYPPSPRHQSVDAMALLRSHIPEQAKAVLVTVDADDATLEAYISRVKPDMLQLHGHESPERCKALNTRFGLPIIKAIGIANTADLLQAQPYSDAADMLLLDTKRADGSSGGTGQSFEWEMLRQADMPLPFFLSGGIGVHNVAQAISLGATPYLDVSSLLEGERGIKDCAKIDALMKMIDQSNAIN